MHTHIKTIGEINMASVGSVSYAKNNPGVRQIVTTSKGEQ